MLQYNPRLDQNFQGRQIYSKAVAVGQIFFLEFLYFSIYKLHMNRYINHNEKYRIHGGQNLKNSVQSLNLRQMPHPPS